MNIAITWQGDLEEKDVTDYPKTMGDHTLPAGWRVTYKPRKGSLGDYKWYSPEGEKFVSWPKVCMR